MNVKSAMMAAMVASLFTTFIAVAFTLYRFGRSTIEPEPEAFGAERVESALAYLGFSFAVDQVLYVNLDDNAYVFLTSTGPRGCGDNVNLSQARFIGSAVKVLTGEEYRRLTGKQGTLIIRPVDEGLWLVGSVASDNLYELGAGTRKLRRNWPTDTSIHRLRGQFGS